LLADAILMTAQGLANFISMVQNDRELLPEAFIAAIRLSLGEGSELDDQDTNEAVDH
jgi:hypothetical protein